MHAICITFDTDWVPVGVMEQLRLLDLFPGRSTHFCTDRYDYLYGNRHRVEFAPHPNFHNGHGDWFKTLADIEAKLPERGPGFRAHCLGYSQRLAMHLKGSNYRYVSQATRLEETGMMPYRHTWGLWEMPIYYCDNTDFSERSYWPDGRAPFRKSVIENAVSKPGLYVFLFHPVHLALNTPSLDEHSRVRDRFYNEVKRATPELVHQGYGTMSFFTDLADAMRAKGLPSVTLEDVLKEVEGKALWTPQAAS